MSNYMKNLVIGNTSQLAQYFPDSYEKISSRNIDESIFSQKWNDVYVCFAEQRTFLANSPEWSQQELFYDINCRYTKKCISKLVPCSERIVYYSTAELWNDCIGPINLETNPKFNPNHYTISKHEITVELQDRRKYPNVRIHYPFNFNGIKRSTGYLFGMVFQSLVNRTPIEIGDTQFYRELLHPLFVVKESIQKTGEDCIIGSGRLTHINDFIKNLYSFYGMEYDDYVTEKIVSASKYRIRPFYSEHKNSLMGEDQIFSKMTDEISAERSKQ